MRADTRTQPIPGRSRYRDAARAADTGTRLESTTNCVPVSALRPRFCSVSAPRTDHSLSSRIRLRYARRFLREKQRNFGPAGFANADETGPGSSGLIFSLYFSIGGPGASAGGHAGFVVLKAIRHPDDARRGVEQGRSG